MFLEHWKICFWNKFFYTSERTKIIEQNLPEYISVVRTKDIRTKRNPPTLLKKMFLETNLYCTSERTKRIGTKLSRISVVRTKDIRTKRTPPTLLTI
jgi:hypothetical protein